MIVHISISSWSPSNTSITNFPMSLYINLLKETHQNSVSIIHEVLIVLNTIYFALITYYLLYELLSILFVLLGYPELPIQRHNIQIIDNKSSFWLEITYKISLLIGAFLGLIGSASWRLLPTLLSILISAFDVIKDIYLTFIGKFYIIDIENFLLFQSLFITTLRTIRIITFVSNLLVMFQFSFSLPKEVSIFDFL